MKTAFRGWTGKGRAAWAAALGGLLWAMAACSTPDPEGKYNDFVAETADVRSGGPADVDTPDGVEGDFSGTYLLGLTTPIGGPLLFEVTVEATDTENVFDFTVQGLKTDIIPGSTNPRPDARAPTGDPISVTGVDTTGGRFEVVLGSPQAPVGVPGDANPITGSDITAYLALQGVAVSLEEFCGTVTGMVIDPLPLDLVGSTFGAVQTDDVTTVAEIPVMCPENVTPGDPEPDAGPDVIEDVPEEDMVEPDVPDDAADDLATDVPADGAGDVSPDATTD